ncbi:MAG: phosphotransferase family protein [Candidatus Heimdallarchaeaceae archaeon]
MNIDATEIKHKLHQYLKSKQFLAPDFSIQEFNRISDGWETEIFAFKLALESDKQNKQEKLILRMYPGKGGKEKAEKEYNIMSNLLHAGYPVPEVKLVETNKEHLGKPFLIMERIDGVNMGKLFLSSDESKRNELLVEFCKLFVQLHNVDIKHVSTNPAIIMNKSSKFFIEQYLSQYKQDIEKYQINELLPIYSWLMNKINQVEKGKTVLIHFDFHPHNILLDKKQKPYVIDWASAHISDFRVDLGWSLLLIEAFLTSETRDLVLETYEKVSGIRVKRIELFEVLAILRRLLDLTISFKVGATERGMREKATQQMRDSAFHIKNIYNILHKKTGLKLRNSIFT